MQSHSAKNKNRNKTPRINDYNHLIRRRINALLADAAKNSVVIVSAGAGCGKMRAVSDFLRQDKRPSFWVQLNENDNSPARFWENFTNVVMHYDAALVDKYREIGVSRYTGKNGAVFNA